MRLAPVLIPNRAERVTSKIELDVDVEKNWWHERSADGVNPKVGPRCVKTLQQVINKQLIIQVSLNAIVRICGLSCRNKPWLRGRLF